MLDEPTTSTGAPGCSASGGPTVRQPSTTLSETLAIDAGSTPSGMGNSIVRANGTRTRSARAPPQSPPTDPRPYIAPGDTAPQLPVTPALQGSHSPHEIWKEATTRSPGRTPAASPASATSPTNSCPSSNG